MNSLLFFRAVVLVLLPCSAATAQAVFKDAPVDAAMPPVAVENLRPILDKDLSESLTKGALAPAAGCGIVVGVIQHGVRRIFTYGALKKDSIFEIGSITKTFTGLLLAQMIQQGKVRIDEPVRALLPRTMSAKPSPVEVTLLDLTTQHSGIPSTPDNMHPKDPNNPFADYGSQELYAYLSKRGLEHKPGTHYAYSNTGVKLLAQALSVRAGVSYSTLLKQEITGPLHMQDTGVEVAPSLQTRVVQGHDNQHHPVEAWTFSDLPGAGGIHSTANDMLTYLEAQLHPELVGGKGYGATLRDAIVLTHQIRDEANPGMHISMNWFHSDEDGNYQHGGRTAGFIAYALFNVRQDFGVIVLSNTTGAQDSISVRLANHIGQRLLGLPALSLREKE